MASFAEGAPDDEGKIVPTKATVHLALATDDAYALPVAVAGRSVIENLGAGATVTLWVLDLGLKDESRERILRSWPHTNARFVTIPDELLKGLPLSTHDHADRLPLSIYGYLFMPAIVAPHTNRVVCMDADMLATGDVSPLWNVDLGDNCFGAVQDPYVLTLANRGFDESLEELHAHPQGKYFNSGMLVIDIPRWLDRNITAAAITYARRHEALDYPDQDCLNATACNDWHELGSEWNFQVGRSFISTFSGRLPQVLHFGGPRKPWTVGCAIPHFQHTYNAYQRLTAYAAKMRGPFDEEGP